MKNLALGLREKLLKNPALPGLGRASKVNGDLLEGAGGGSGGSGGGVLNVVIEMTGENTGTANYTGAEIVQAINDEKSVALFVKAGGAITMASTPSVYVVSGTDPLLLVGDVLNDTYTYMQFGVNRDGYDCAVLSLNYTMTRKD